MTPDYIQRFERWAVERMNDITARCKHNKAQRCYPTMGNMKGSECMECFDTHNIASETSGQG